MGIAELILAFEPNFEAVTNADHWVVKMSKLQLLEGTCVMDIL